MVSNPYQILLVEDDPGDAELTRIGLSRSGVAVELTVLSGGKAALDFLVRQDTCPDSHYPHLILLDLNLPGMSGREVLVQIKERQGLCSIPIVILSTSDAKTDIEQTYALGANCYVTKKIDLEQFMSSVEQVKNFWLNIAELPL